MKFVSVCVPTNNFNYKCSESDDRAVKPVGKCWTPFKQSDQSERTKYAPTFIYWRRLFKKTSKQDWYARCWNDSMKSRFKGFIENTMAKLDCDERYYASEEEMKTVQMETLHHTDT